MLSNLPLLCSRIITWLTVSRLPTCLLSNHLLAFKLTSACHVSPNSTATSATLLVHPLFPLDPIPFSPLYRISYVIVRVLLLAPSWVLNNTRLFLLVCGKIFGNVLITVSLCTALPWDHFSIKYIYILLVWDSVGGAIFFVCSVIVIITILLLSRVLHATRNT